MGRGSAGIAAEAWSNHGGAMRKGTLSRIATACLVAGWLSAGSAPAGAQSCSWSISGKSPPSAVSLRAYRGQFHSPARVAVSGSGRVYVSEPRLGRVVVRDALGRLESMLEGLGAPIGIAVDRFEHIYVGEQARGRVAVYDQNWNFLHVLGRGDGEFLMPNDIAVDFETDDIFISDSDAHSVKVYSGAGGFLRSFGAKGSGAGEFDSPAGIYVTPVGVSPTVEVYVADQNNDRVQVLDRNGNFLRCVGGKGSSFSNRFGRVQGVTVDAQGKLYVADAFQGYVQVFDRFGLRLSIIGSFGKAGGQLRTPIDVAFDPYNRLFATSANNSRVEIYGIDAFSDPKMVAAVVDMRPDSVKRSKKKDFISSYIEMRASDLAQVDVASITANGVPALPGSDEIGDYDADGVPDLRIDFDQATLLGTVPDGDVEILVAGKFAGGDAFEGSDTLRVMAEKGEKK